MKSNSKNLIKAVAISIIAILLALYSTTVTVEAAKTTNVSVGYSNWRTAKSVKIGDNKVTTAKGNFNKQYATPFVRFKAPKNGKYKFTFTNLSSPKSSRALGSCSIYKSNGDELITASFPSNNLTLKTEGGKVMSLFLTTRQSPYESGSLKYRPLTKRTTTLNLKKGEIIYISNNMLYKSTYKLNIKKVK